MHLCAINEINMHKARKASGLVSTCASLSVSTLRVHCTELIHLSHSSTSSKQRSDSSSDNLKLSMSEIQDFEAQQPFSTIPTNFLRPF